MEEYLVDREALGEFIDGLIKKKALPVDNAEELNKIREEGMRTLDDEICFAIFGDLSDGQAEELGELLEKEKQNPEAFKNFFEKEGINLQQIIESTMTNFAKTFVGGENE